MTPEAKAFWLDFFHQAGITKDNWQDAYNALGRNHP